MKGAYMHNWLFNALKILHSLFAGIFQSGIFFDGQCVHVSTQKDDGSSTVLESGSYAGLANALLYVQDIILLELVVNLGCGFMLLKRQFWLCVEMLIEKLVTGEVGTELIDDFTDAQRHLY